MPNSRTKAKQNQAEALLERIINTDEKAALVWTTLGLRELAEAATKQGGPVSYVTLRKAMLNKGYTLRMDAARSRENNANHLSPGEQCRYINSLVDYCVRGRIPALYLDFDSHLLTCKDRKKFDLGSHEIPFKEFPKDTVFSFPCLSANMKDKQSPDSLRLAGAFGKDSSFYLLEGRRPAAGKSRAPCATESIGRWLRSLYSRGPVVIVYGSDRPLHRAGEFRAALQALAPVYGPLYVSWLPPCSFKWRRVYAKSGFLYPLSRIASFDLAAVISLLSQPAPSICRNVRLPAGKSWARFDQPRISGPPENVVTDNWNEVF